MLNINLDIETRMREEFAKLCFETLLSFSFASTNKSGETAITQTSMKSLVSRCKEVLKNYAFDERMAGACPLPKYVMLLNMYIVIKYMIILNV